LKAKTYNNMQLLGLMSGTSLDGLDIAHVAFDFSNSENTDFELLNYCTYPLPQPIFKQLFDIFSLSAQQVFELDQQLAHFYANCVAAFVNDFGINKEQITAIASHGQTIFHQPQKGYTTQIGCGATLNFLTKIPVINQFRTLDVSAGGQGAPLVPIGDKLLFSKFANGFLNLGGFANISSQQNTVQIAYDIAPANLPMNRWMQSIGKSYDQNGALARTGTVDLAAYQKVMDLDFFMQNGPKSLGTEWLDQAYLPLFEDLSLADRLRTHVEVLKNLCIKHFEVLGLQKVYLTGGGAHHQFLVELLQKSFRGELILPEPALIDYKEALIFAFLGARYLRNETTTLSEVTGAQEALRTGVLHDFQGRIW
jgi:anhydro-N-acetylmuramic acid kinase